MNNKNIFIIDWDDTLFPTTYLNPYKDILHLSSGIKYELRLLEKEVEKLLTIMKKHGDVYIVTAAERTWVELILKNIYIHLDKNINIISARDKYIHLYNNNPYKWKYYTFQDIIYDKLNNENLTIFSIGDSDIERNALKTVSKDLIDVNGIIIKIIKLAEQPHINQLQKEIELLNNTFNFLVNYTDNLNLELSIKTC